ncbi:hypothetical protein ACFLY2_00505 [Patescibacteria group bacterium]
MSAQFFYSQIKLILSQTSNQDSISIISQSLDHSLITLYVQSGNNTFGSQSL